MLSDNDRNAATHHDRRPYACNDHNPNSSHLISTFIFLWIHMGLGRFGRAGLRLPPARMRRESNEREQKKGEERAKRRRESGSEQSGAGQILHR